MEIDYILGELVDIQAQAIMISNRVSELIKKLNVTSKDGQFTIDDLIKDSVTVLSNCTDKEFVKLVQEVSLMDNKHKLKFIYNFFGVNHTGEANTKICELFHEPTTNDIIKKARIIIKTAARSDMYIQTVNPTLVILKDYMDIPSLSVEFRKNLIANIVAHIEGSLTDYSLISVIIKVNEYLNSLFYNEI